MRTLLFVQTGDARPKCADDVWPAKGWHRSRMTRREQRGEYMLSPHQLSEMDAADRWWLVECENADAGRTAISYSPNDCDCETPVCKHTPSGRILASGGRRA